MLKIRPFSLDDYPIIRPYIERILGKMQIDTGMFNTKHCYTGLADEKIFGVAGVTQKWTGVYTAWLLPTSFIKTRDWVYITKHTLDVFNDILSKDCIRIEATVRSDFSSGHRWAKRLGFEPEGVMKHYAPDGSDHVLYARVK